MAIGSPLHPKTAPLCVSHQWRDWAGHWAASCYDTQHSNEYFAIRNTAALIDVSPLYKYLITGRDALRLMNRVMTKDLSRLDVGDVSYGPWCNAQGKVIDDGTVSVLSPTCLRVTAAEPNLRWFYMNGVGLHVEITDISECMAALAIQGPNSRDILGVLCDQDLSFLKYFKVTEARTGTIPLTISRTGYTGDLGYELWVDAENALPLWDRLIQAGNRYGLQPAGILALDMARVEAGFILQDVDYVSANKALIATQFYSPYELGLSWTVHLAKNPPFVGQAALAAEKQAGPQRRFVGLRIDWDHLESLYAEQDLPPKLVPQAWRTPVPIFDNGTQIGVATSGTWSPTLKEDLAIGTVDRGYATFGRHVYIHRMIAHRLQKVRAQIVKLPFFNPPRKRS